ncbi:MAG: hypothetical protein E4G96_09220 [Chrysiogenales bacterium]|nr:MAG: hypothetical protein E4G96_09220 [Chrysiogenales bacterium]
MKRNSIAIIIATKIEAEPFIDGLRLPALGKGPVPLYGNDSLLLAVSGIGKSNAAAATVFLIERHHPSLVINCGAAGAANPGMHVGDIFQIDRVYELDRPHLVHGRPMIHRPDTMKGFTRASLATQDRPVIGGEERLAAAQHADLLDMEGAAIVQTCHAFVVPVYLFKIVSDTTGHGRKEIIDRMLTVRHDLFAFFMERILPGIT